MKSNESLLKIKLLIIVDLFIFFNSKAQESDAEEVFVVRRVEEDLVALVVASVVASAAAKLDGAVVASVAASAVFDQQFPIFVSLCWHQKWEEAVAWDIAVEQGMTTVVVAERDMTAVAAVAEEDIATAVAEGQNRAEQPAFQEELDHNGSRELDRVFVAEGIAEVVEVVEDKVEGRVEVAEDIAVAASELLAEKIEAAAAAAAAVDLEARIFHCHLSAFC